MKNTLIYIFVLFLVKAGAQNLVPNPSFEVYTTCPSGPGQVINATSWYSPNGGTPDYFNSCATNANYDVPSNMFGFQNAHIGNAYVGMVVYITFTSSAGEYVQTHLLDTLIANEAYCVSFYVSPADFAKWGCDKIGCYFSSTAVTSCGSCLMPYIPQVESSSMIKDTAAWIKVSGVYTATGNEQYLTIGNFRLNANTDTTTINPSVNNPEAYFYIDDVSLSIIESANAGGNKNICLGDSVQIGASSNSAGTYSWSPVVGLSNTTIAQPMASPKQTTVYTLTKTTACNISTNSITITVIDDCMSSASPQIPNIFTPNNDGTNDVFSITCKNIKTLNCKIYNRWGILVNELTKPNEAWDGRTTAGLPCTEGVYYYVLSAEGIDEKEYDEKGFLQLVK